MNFYDCFQLSITLRFMAVMFEFSKLSLFQVFLTLFNRHKKYHYPPKCILFAVEVLVSIFCFLT